MLLLAKGNNMIALRNYRHYIAGIYTLISGIRDFLELYNHIYKVFFTDQSKDTKQEGLLSSSIYSTNIQEEVSVFKDENGEIKTIISRKILKKVTNPGQYNLEDDNTISCLHEQHLDNLRNMALSIYKDSSQPSIETTRLGGESSDANPENSNSS